MGSQAECTVEFEGKVSKGKALLESEALLFRGDFRLSIPLKDLTAVDVNRGQLQVTSPQGRAIFNLGPLAEKWAAKIRNPRSLLDKLGVKPDSQVAVLGIKDENFWQQLKERTSKTATSRPKKESDLIFLAAGQKGDLEQLAELQGYLKRDGAIWVVWPKGKAQLKESDVMAAAKVSGMVDVKVVKFSESHSALKLVIPVSRR